MFKTIVNTVFNRRARTKRDKEDMLQRIFCGSRVSQMMGSVLVRGMYPPGPPLKPDPTATGTGVWGVSMANILEGMEGGKGRREGKEGREVGKGRREGKEGVKAGRKGKKEGEEGQEGVKGVQM